MAFVPVALVETPSDGIISPLLIEIIAGVGLVMVGQVVVWAFIDPKNELKMITAIEKRSNLGVRVWQYLANSFRE